MVKVAADSFMGLFSTSAASAAAKALAYPIAAVGDWQVMADICRTRSRAHGKSHGSSPSLRCASGPGFSPEGGSFR